MLFTVVHGYSAHFNELKPDAPHVTMRSYRHPGHSRRAFGLRSMTSDKPGPCPGGREVTAQQWLVFSIASAPRGCSTLIEQRIFFGAHPALPP